MTFKTNKTEKRTSLVMGNHVKGNASVSATATKGRLLPSVGPLV